MRSDKARLGKKELGERTESLLVFRMCVFVCNYFSFILRVRKEERRRRCTEFKD